MGWAATDAQMRFYSHCVASGHGLWQRHRWHDVTGLVTDKRWLVGIIPGASLLQTPCDRGALVRRYVQPSPCYVQVNRKMALPAL